MKVDVCMVSKDKASFKGKEHIAIERFIKSHACPIAVARYEAIQLVNTKWFLFVDDDIEVTGKCGLFRYMGEDVGAIEGRKLVKGLGSKWDKAINDFIREKPVATLKLGERGFTSYVLMRTEIARKWLPRYENEFCYEDWDLSQFILKKGFKWLVVNNYVFHRKTWGKVVKSAFWAMRGFKLFNNAKEILRMYAKLLFSIPYWFLRVDLNLRVRTYIVFCNASCILGLTRKC